MAAWRQRPQSASSASRWDWMDGFGSRVLSALGRLVVRAPKITLLSTKTADRNTQDLQFGRRTSSSTRADSLPVLNVPSATSRDIRRSSLRTLSATPRDQLRRRSLGTFGTEEGAKRRGAQLKFQDLSAVTDVDQLAWTSMDAADEMQADSVRLRRRQSRVESTESKAMEQAALRHAARAGGQRRLSGSEEPDAVRQVSPPRTGWDLVGCMPAYRGGRRGSM
ncbi:hypothetical protein T484DRAFT_1984027 [Baffinella frigidus]|nr:hypothetical protein T484DRAFT_1984027 [Cryptophyta sp. CCMP2293]|eukprot:CAMPEP_0180219348 /NCGR_PEP_ID=MMETSP0987-20121128/18397_1 /TAXON_ID=697907 /ORGANISM="non described non described, Strain CCMP2293" /LENGTH=221 /DNA_ID=CAMNT_0022179899 /DNA_START=23 /DNA_END=688 /DNA_ORIENTATION=-